MSSRTKEAVRRFGIVGGNPMSSASIRAIIWGEQRFYKTSSVDLHASSSKPEKPDLAFVEADGAAEAAMGEDEIVVEPLERIDKLTIWMSGYLAEKRNNQASPSIDRTWNSLMDNFAQDAPVANDLGEPDIGIVIYVAKPQNSPKVSVVDPNIPRIGTRYKTSGDIWISDVLRGLSNGGVNPQDFRMWRGIKNEFSEFAPAADDRPSVNQNT